MRIVQAAAVLSFALLGDASPRPVGYNTTSALATRGNATSLVAAGQACTIYGFYTSDCSGPAFGQFLFAYGGCKYTCKAFDNGHSFLVRDCPWDAHFYACPEDCATCNYEQNTVKYDISPNNCYHVNTGQNWMSGWVCNT